MSKLQLTHPSTCMSRRVSRSFWWLFRSHLCLIQFQIKRFVGRFSHFHFVFPAWLRIPTLFRKDSDRIFIFLISGLNVTAIPRLEERCSPLKGLRVHFHTCSKPPRLPSTPCGAKLLWILCICSSDPSDLSRSSTLKCVISSFCLPTFQPTSGTLIPSSVPPNGIGTAAV